MATTSIGDILLLLGDEGLDDQYPECRDRFRRYLMQSKWEPSDVRGWIEECQEYGSRSQPHFYYALQDIVTSLGHQLGMEVEYGSYGGATAPIPFDGCWTLASGQILLIEVKSALCPFGSATQLGRYMDALCKLRHRAPSEVLGLLAIGSGDFQPIIDQIKGSDYRNRQKLISFDDLIGLVELARQMARTSGPSSLNLIQNLLMPFESVNVGSLLDIITQISQSHGAPEKIARSAESLFIDSVPTHWQKTELCSFLDSCKPMQYALLMALAFSPQQWTGLGRLIELMQVAADRAPGLPVGYVCSAKTVGGARSGLSKRQQQAGKEPFILTRGTRYALHERYLDWTREWLVEQGMIIPAEFVADESPAQVFSLFNVGEV
jgi:hypothetical protein